MEYEVRRSISFDSREHIHHRCGWLTKVAQAIGTCIVATDTIGDSTILLLIFMLDATDSPRGQRFP